MKGVVFCEFLDFVEASAGYDVVDQMIVDASPPSGGAYTAVGRYDYTEMAALVAAFSRIVERPAGDVLFDFGRHLFGRLAETHPRFLEGVSDPIAFLETVEDQIHVEVKKLYPDAELPSLAPTRLGDDAIALDYRSCRPLGALCRGLIDGCAAHFGVALRVDAETRPDGLRIVVSRAAAPSLRAPAPTAAAAEA